jgi:hypothetical protein
MSDEETVHARVRRGTHERIEGGERVRYDPGQEIPEMPVGEYEQWSHKLDRLDADGQNAPSSPTRTVQPQMGDESVDTPSRPESDSASAESESGDGGDASGADEPDDESSDDGSESASSEALEFVDRNASTVRNAVDAGHADGKLDRVYAAESSKDDPRVTVQREIVERMQEQGDDSPDDWDDEADEPKSSSDE